MSKVQPAQPEEQQTKWRRGRPTGRQVLWAGAMVAALVATVLQIVNLFPDTWRALLEERVVTLIRIGATLTVIIVLLAIGGASRGWTGFANRTVWEWLHLLGTLAIPVVVAVATAWFSSQQSTTQTQIEERRAQDEALQAYLEQMSTLLLDKDLRFSTEDNATEDSKQARTLARARTLTVLGRLDPSRKTAVMQFLVEAELVQSVYVGGVYTQPIITLTGANLSGANLSDADLSGANLSDANLSGANLHFARLDEANLYDADLSGANLSGASLINTNLSYANLQNADLSIVSMRNADLSCANLSDASGVPPPTEEWLEGWSQTMEGATMPDGSVHGVRCAKEAPPSPTAQSTPDPIPPPGHL
jgi:uncharacterized protein YjbI with pentapeptide repeats